MPELTLEQIYFNRVKGNSSAKVLNAINLEVERGVIYTILGPSGSGKSTLLRLINRLSEPSSGNIYFQGLNIRDIPVTSLRQKIGMVFQQPALFPGSVAENILYGPRLRGERSNAADYLKLVGLGDGFGAREVNELSGGEQQRVALARTLANRPEMLLLDEPTSALDRHSAECIEELVKKFSSEGLTVMWVTHSASQARRIGNRTLLLVEGAIIEDKATDAFFTQPESPLTSGFLKGKNVEEDLE